MILSWIVYALLVSVLLCIAGLLGERALRGRCAGTRWTWVLTLGLSLAVPLILPSLDVAHPHVDPTSIQSGVSHSQEQWLYTRTGLSSTRQSLDERLSRAWLALSLIALSVLGAGALFLDVRRRSWRRTIVCGTAVYVSPNTGPAVFGGIRSHIVIRFGF